MNNSSAAKLRIIIHIVKGKVLSYIAWTATGARRRRLEDAEGNQKFPRKPLNANNLPHNLPKSRINLPKSRIFER